MTSLLHQLIEAVMTNDVNAVKDCLAQGVDPNAYEDAARIRPLHFAVMYKALDCAKLLLSLGADPFAEDQDGNTPLELAEVLKYLEMVALLTLASEEDEFTTVH